MKYYPTRQIKSLETFDGGGTAILLLDDSRISYDKNDPQYVLNSLRSAPTSLLFPEPKLDEWVPGKPYAVNDVFSHAESDPADADAGTVFRWRVVAAIEGAEFESWGGDNFDVQARLERESSTDNVTPVQASEVPTWIPNAAYSVDDVFSHFESDPESEEVGTVFRWRVVNAIAENEFSAWNRAEFAIQAELQRLV